jgi:hypothetical protein
MKYRWVGGCVPSSCSSLKVKAIRFSLPLDGLGPNGRVSLAGFRYAAFSEGLLNLTLDVTDLILPGFLLFSCFQPPAERRQTGAPFGRGRRRRGPALRQGFRRGQNPLQGLDQALNVVAPALVPQFDGVAARKRPQWLGQLVGARHLRPLNEGRDHPRVTPECCLNLQLHPVIRHLETASPLAAGCLRHSGPISAMTTSANSTSCWTTCEKSSPEGITSMSIRTLSSPNRSLSSSDNRLA